MDQSWDGLQELSRLLWEGRGVPFEWSTRFAPHGTLDAAWYGSSNFRTLVEIYECTGDHHGLVAALFACVTAVATSAPTLDPLLASTLDAVRRWIGGEQDAVRVFDVNNALTVGEGLAGEACSLAYAVAHLAKVAQLRTPWIRRSAALDTVHFLRYASPALDPLFPSMFRALLPVPTLAQLTATASA